MTTVAKDPRNTATESVVISSEISETEKTLALRKEKFLDQPAIKPLLQTPIFSVRNMQAEVQGFNGRRFGGIFCKV